MVCQWFEQGGKWLCFTNINVQCSLHYETFEVILGMVSCLALPVSWKLLIARRVAFREGATRFRKCCWGCRCAVAVELPLVNNAISTYVHSAIFGNQWPGGESKIGSGVRTLTYNAFWIWETTHALTSYLWNVSHYYGPPLYYTKMCYSKLCKYENKYHWV